MAEADLHARRKALEAIRDDLTAEMNAIERGEDARAKALISRELRATWAELDALPIAKGASPVDELAKRRAKRRSGASAASRS